MRTSSLPDGEPDPDVPPLTEPLGPWPLVAEALVPWPRLSGASSLLAAGRGRARAGRGRPRAPAGPLVGAAVALRGRRRRDRRLGRFRSRGGSGGDRNVRLEDGSRLARRRADVGRPPPPRRPPWGRRPRAATGRPPPGGPCRDPRRA